MAARTFILSFLFPIYFIFQLPSYGQQPSRINYDFETVIETAETLPRIRSLLVSQKGELILEKYFNGTNSYSTTNIKSVSKSIISALIGIAIEQNHITDINQPIIEYFHDENWPTDNALKSEITIKNLLTMQSGLETTSNRNYGNWISSENWVSFVLHQPLDVLPGRIMEYSSGNTHLLSALLTKATGLTTHEFANDVLANELGFTLKPWPKDPQGIFFGGNDMEMTPEQMLIFGELYLNNGKIGNKQIIPSKWIDDSLEHKAQSRRDRTRYYGYGWWMKEMAGHETYYAWGFGGQFIVVVPILELVIVTTSSSNPGPKRRIHTSNIYDLLELHLIPSISKSLGHTSL